MDDINLNHAQGAETMPDAQGAPLNAQEEVLRLAMLDAPSYERERQAAGKSLYMRLPVLDKQVKAMRAELAAAQAEADRLAELERMRRDEAEREARFAAEHDARQAQNPPADEDSPDLPPPDDCEGSGPTKPAYKSPFTLRHGGLFFTPDDEDATPYRVSDALEIAAITRNVRNKEHGRLLQWQDADGIKHDWAMPMEELAGDGTEVFRKLLSGGLGIASGPKARKLLLNYLQSERPTERARCTSRTGWHGKRFVLPDCTIGDAGEPVLLQGIDDDKNAFTTCGTADGWREHVGRLAAGNSRIVFGLSAAFAAPLLELVGETGGGFHLSGASSTGKSTALVAAASVWGNPTAYAQNWRATANGMEGIASLHNDLLLILDEIGQADAKEAGDTVYMLANGCGKQRANRDGGARASKTWRLLWLSAGECGLTEHMRAGGKRTHAGQEVRLANIPADAGAGFGVFDTLHQLPDGAALSKTLKHYAAQHYGHAGRDYLRALTEDPDAIAKDTKRFRRDFIKQHLPNAADGQVERVLSRVALVAFAGELATQAGITGWRDGEAADAAAICFKAWLGKRGGAGSAEDAALLAQIRAFFEAHGSSRFEEMAGEARLSIVNRAGFIRKAGEDTEYLVLPETFKRELCAGMDAGSAAKLMLSLGWLRPDADGKPQKREYLPELGRIRVYVFKVSAMGEADAF